MNYKWLCFRIMLKVKKLKKYFTTKTLRTHRNTKGFNCNDIFLTS